MRETPEAALAFERYYTLGEDRTLASLAQKMHQELTQKNSQEPTRRIPTLATLLTQLKKWSTEHKWQQRIIERDRLHAEKERKKKQKEVEKMNEEHALLGRTQALRAVKQIEELIKSNKFGSQATVQLFKHATDLERVARGAATERQEVVNTESDVLSTIAEKIEALRATQQERVDEA